MLPACIRMTFSLTLCHYPNTEMRSLSVTTRLIATRIMWGGEFKRRLLEIAQSLDSGAIAKEEAVVLISTALEESFSETRTSKEQLAVALQFQGGQWVLSGSEQGRIMNYIFSLTTEAENHGLSDSEYEKSSPLGLL